MKTIIGFLLIIAAQFSVGQELALVKKGKNIGFIDKTGNMVIEPAYVRAGSFSDGLAAVLIDGLWGYIDTRGQIVIEPQFTGAKPFNSGLAIAEKDKQWQYIDKSGKTVKMPHSDKRYDFDAGGLAIIKVSDLVGLINAKGNEVLKPTYHEIKPFENAFAKVRRDNKWGIIGRDGRAVIEPEYDDIDVGGGAVFTGRKGTAHGVVTKSGQFIHVEDVTKIWPFPDGETLTYARKNDRMGFVNQQGDWVIEPQYDKARAFRNGLAPVYVGKNWGYINAKGEMVIKPQYPDAEIFSRDGLAPVKVGKEWGFVDASGELTIPAQYAISVALVGFLTGGDEKGFINGLARVKHKGKWGFINTKGQVIGNEWFENAELFGN